jgi:hypothetical protein
MNKASPFLYLRINDEFNPTSVASSDTLKKGYDLKKPEKSMFPKNVNHT